MTAEMEIGMMTAPSSTFYADNKYMFLETWKRDRKKDRVGTERKRVLHIRRCCDDAAV